MTPAGAAAEGTSWRIAARLGWLGAAIGGIVLLGWIADVPLLRSWLPGEVGTKANSAVCLLLAGFALAWKARSTDGRTSKLAAVAAALVAFVGLITVAEYVFGRDFGVDQLLFRETGRMALPSACNFLFIGWAVLLVRPGRDSRIATVLAVPVVLLACLAFVGQLYNLPALTSFETFTPMALPTGMAFLLLGVGGIFASWSHAGEWLRRSGHAAALALSLLLLVLLGGAVMRNTSAQIANTRHVAHTYEVLDRLALLLSAMQDVETASRGYVLTGDPAFLEPYQTAPATATRLEGELRELTRDNLPQQRRLDSLQVLVDRKLAATAGQITLRRNGDTAAAREIVAGGRGREAMDAIRDQMIGLRAEEQRLLAERSEALRTATARTLVTLVLGLAAACVLLLTSFAFLRREIVRRTRMALALRRSEESLAVTMRSIGDAVLATDTGGRVTLLNPVAEELTGWKLAEARGRPVADVFRIVNEETRAPARIPVAEVLATGEIQALANHTALIARDGRERAIEDSAAPIRGEDGRILGVVLVFRDVTTSRRAQLELEKFFRLSVDCLCISSANGYFLRVSPGITGILGWSVEEFLARPYLELVHPDDNKATADEVARQMASGAPVLNFENRYRHKDGSWRMISWRSVPDPQTGMMYGTARDITERKQAEDRIRELNTELRELFESLPGLYLVLSTQYDIVAASDAYLKATMTTRETIVGRNLFEIFPDNPDDPKADGTRNLRASLERVLAQRAPDTMPIQKYDVRRPDGVFEERYWSPINSPLFAPDRTVRYIIHRAEDVTDFVRQRDGGDRNGADLHTRLQQMEAEIFASSQSVQAANAQLHLANQELEAFSYSVSHDLRAPLRHIQGYVEMLTREVQAVLTPKAQRYLKTIADAGREMGELIDDLLAFSRMGRAEMSETELDLAPIIEEVRSGLELSTRDRDIRWTIAPLPRVRGDAAMLRQVLANLVGNAVKYSRKRGQAEIAIGCSGEEEGKTVFFVRDNGAGFDMKYADKLFGVFQRLHRADEFEGTGIGLASVRRIVARHGGRTWAESKLDAGATFYFSLQPAIPAPVQS